MDERVATNQPKTQIGLPEVKWPDPGLVELNAYRVLSVWIMPESDHHGQAVHRLRGRSNSLGV